MIATVRTVDAATEPTALVDGSSGSYDKPRSVVIRNDSSTTVYLGGPTLIASNATNSGFSLAQGAAVQLELVNEDVFATTASGTANVSILASGS